MFVCLNNKGNLSTLDYLVDTDYVDIWDSKDKTVQSVCVEDLRKYNIRVKNLYYSVHGVTGYTYYGGVVEFEKCGHHVKFTPVRLQIDDKCFKLSLDEWYKSIYINKELCVDLFKLGDPDCGFNGVDIHGTVAVVYVYVRGLLATAGIKFVVDINTWEFGVYKYSEDFMIVKKPLNDGLSSKLNTLGV